MTVGMALGTIGLVVIAQVDARAATTLLFAGYLLFGLALGFVYAPMSTAAMTAMPPAKAGIAAGVLAMNRVLAGAITLAVAGAVFQTSSSTTPRGPRPSRRVHVGPVGVGVGARGPVRDRHGADLGLRARERRDGGRPRAPGALALPPPLDRHTAPGAGLISGRPCGILCRVPDLTAPVVPRGRLRGLSQPVLRVDELVARPWDPGDVEALVAAYGDPEIQRWHARSMTPAEALLWVEARAERWQREVGADWAVTDRDRLVGRVGFRVLELREGWAEAAYWVAPHARGRAIASRALRAAGDWMFTRVGLHRFVLAHAVANAASCRVAGKAGYALEGTMRRQTLHPDGWHDMHLHARLRTDGRSGRSLDGDG